MSLMFWGVNYNNPVKYNYFSSNQNLFKSPINLNFLSNFEETPWGPWNGINLSLNLRPEIHYIIYSVISIGIINLNYFRYYKKIRS